MSTSISAACFATSAVWRCGSDDDAGDELEPRRDAGEVAEEHEDLVEQVLGPVRADEVGMACIVRTEHVVVGEEVVEAEVLYGLRVLADSTGICANLRLRENDAELQR